MPENLDTWTVPVGRIRARWDRADFKIQSFSEHGEHFRPGKQLCVEVDGKRRLLTIASSRPKEGGWLCGVGLTDSSEADVLLGGALFIHPEMRLPLEPGQFYLDELCGFRVVTEDGDDWGEIDEILESPAHLVFVTSSAMIPDHPDFVVEIDGPGRRVIVKDVPGLKTGNDAGASAP